MPPVLGPVSPSPTRLWSCAAASATACLPSQSAKKESSSPSRNSSRTTYCLGRSEQRAGEHLCGSLFGLDMGVADDYTLAGGEAVGLDYDGCGEAGEFAGAPRRASVQTA